MMTAPQLGPFTNPTSASLPVESPGSIRSSTTSPHPAGLGLTLLRRLAVSWHLASSCLFPLQQPSVSRAAADWRHHSRMCQSDDSAQGYVLCTSQARPTGIQPTRPAVGFWRVACLVRSISNTWLAPHIGEMDIGPLATLYRRGTKTGELHLQSAESCWVD